MSTLEAELLQAADRTDTCAAYARQVGNFYEAKDHAAEAERLRQRAAWVRELHAEMAAAVFRATGCGIGVLAVIDRELSRFTGPIPFPETAPNERTET